MGRFFLGFLAGTLLLGLVAGVLYARGIVAWVGWEEEVAAVADEPAEEAAPERDPKRRRRPKRSQRSAREGRGGSGEATASSKALPSGEATIGDELDWSGARRVDMAAGEGQLAGSQIEAGFDSVMGRIRRCLVLVPSEGEVKGTLTFGMRVGSDGQPRAVNLSGPAVVVSGESGTCLRQAAQAIRFPRFDGPEMLFRYPITLH